MFDELDPGFHKRGWYRHRSVDERLHNAGIPKRHRRLPVDIELTVPQQKMMDTALGWVEQSPRTSLRGVNLEGDGFVVLGERQTGKTTGGVQILQTLLTDREAPVSGRYTTASELCEMFNDAVRHDGVLGDEWVDPYLLDAITKRFDIVVLDDFGVEPLSTYRIDSLHSLLRRRSAALMPTIIIVHPSISGAEDLDDRYGPAFADFINSTYKTITCTAI